MIEVLFLKGFELLINTLKNFILYLFEFFLGWVINRDIFSAITVGKGWRYFSSKFIKQNILRFDSLYFCLSFLQSSFKRQQFSYKILLILSGFSWYEIALHLLEQADFLVYYIIDWLRVKDSFIILEVLRLIYFQ